MYASVLGTGDKSKLFNDVVDDTNSYHSANTYIHTNSNHNHNHNHSGTSSAAIGGSVDVGKLIHSANVLKAAVSVMHHIMQYIA